MNIKKHIPNFITCLNLFSGSIATYFAFQGEYQQVFIFVLLAAFFDFLDGMAARVLKAYSPLGKELDSLADLISFGLAPGVLAFSLLTSAGINLIWAFSGFIIPVFSALRLAKFNIDERQTSSFIGLPTPANAMLWLGLTYSYQDFLIQNSWTIFALIILTSALLVSEIHLFSLKFKTLKWTENKTRYIFLVGCIVLIILLGFNSLGLIIGWYVLSSLIFPIIFPKNSNPAI